MEDLKLSRRFENAIKAAREDGDNPLSSAVPEEFELSCKDLEYLMDLAFSGDVFVSLRLAFVYGFVMGNRSTHARKLKRL